MDKKILFPLFINSSHQQFVAEIKKNIFHMHGYTTIFHLRGKKQQNIKKVLREIGKDTVTKKIFTSSSTTLHV